MTRTSRDTLVSFLDDYLGVRDIADSSRNGLQIQGTEQIGTVGLAVDAGLETYHRAVEAGCQLLLVHHGLIWGGLTAITGRTYRHVRYLLEHGINLYAAHLPLDMHPESGNNACLARLLSLAELEPFGEYKGTMIGFKGTLPEPLSADGIAASLGERLGGPTLVLPFGPSANARVGIVSGGGSDSLEEAIGAKLDCLITGEPNHANHHLALEGGINVVYCGHYHSEQVGVKAVGKILAERFGVETVFLDVPTMV